jgi:hypothetical protein
MKTNSTLSNKVIFSLAIFSLISISSFAGNGLTPDINYVSINAKVNNKSVVLLNWVANTDTDNNSYLVVEQSFDNINFKAIGVVLDGFDINASQKSYQFKDLSTQLLANTTVYYRLKKVDNNITTETYSKVVAVKLHANVSKATMQAVTD